MGLKVLRMFGSYCSIIFKLSNQDFFLVLMIRFCIVFTVHGQKMQIFRINLPISPGVIPNSLGNNASKENLRTHLCCHLCCSYSAFIDSERTMNKLHVRICEVATLPLLKGMLRKRVFSKRFAQLLKSKKVAMFGS